MTVKYNSNVFVDENKENLLLHQKRNNVIAIITYHSWDDKVIVDRINKRIHVPLLDIPAINSFEIKCHCA